MAEIEEHLSRMTVAEKVGQVLMAVNAPAWADPPDVELLISRYCVGSVISCGYRTRSPSDVARANNALQELAAESRIPVPLLNGGDFEQGVASQVPHGTTALPQQLGLAAAGSLAAVREAAAICGREARAMGFHWTFAPTADVNTDPLNPVIGVRAFGDDPQRVAELTAAQVTAYWETGIAATPKHFPGHGATALDSHRRLPTIDCDLETLDAVHLPPFRAAIGVGARTIMTAHILMPALDPDLPATLSHPTLTGLLREQLGFEGVIITDQMSMKAISSNWGTDTATILAFNAGADIVMMGGTTEQQVATVRALRAAAEHGTIRKARLEASVRRVLKLKQECGLFESALVDVDAAAAGASPEHEACAQRLARNSITTVKNEGILPLQAGAARTLVAGVTNHSLYGNVSATHVPTVAAMIERYSPGGAVWYSADEDPSEVEITEVVAEAQRADQIVVLTYARGALPAGQARLVAALCSVERPIVAVSVGTPYDIASYPQVPAYVATYAQSFVPIHLVAPSVLEAVVDVLFGAKASGRLPVEIPGLYPRGHSHVPP